MVMENYVKTTNEIPLNIFQKNGIHVIFQPVWKKTYIKWKHYIQNLITVSMIIKIVRILWKNISKVMFWMLIIRWYHQHLNVICGVFACCIIRMYLYWDILWFCISFVIRFYFVIRFCCCSFVLFQSPIWLKYSL